MTETYELDLLFSGVRRNIQHRRNLVIVQDTFLAFGQMALKFRLAGALHDTVCLMKHWA